MDGEVVAPADGTTPVPTGSTEIRMTFKAEVVPPHNKGSSPTVLVADKVTVGIATERVKRISAKTNSTTRGWAHLPPNILQLIISSVEVDLVQKTDEKTLIVDYTIATRHNRPAAFEVAKYLTKRIWLCSARAIHPSWKQAIDSHPWWLEYSTIIDPIRHQAHLARLHADLHASSNRRMPSLFHQAWLSTILTCLPCRLNFPDIQPKPIGQTGGTRYTIKFGYMESCIHHSQKGTFCQNCLVFTDRIMFDKRAELFPTRFYKSGDIDTEGNPIPHGGSMCNLCVQDILYNTITDIFIQRDPKYLDLNNNNNNNINQNRGIRGISNDKIKIWKIWREEDSYMTELKGGKIFINQSAESAIDILWLQQQTDYILIRPKIYKLSINYRNLKKKFMLEDKVESVQQRACRLILLRDIFGPDYTVDYTEDAIAIANLYAEWKHELDEWGYDSEDEEDDPDNGEYSSNTWMPKSYEDMVKTASMKRFITNRINSGFWILPSTEARYLALLNPDDERPSIVSRDIRKYTHPLLENPDDPIQEYPKFPIKPSDALKSGTGYITMDTHRIRGYPGMKDPFLPSPSMLFLLDNTFKDIMRRRLALVFANITKTYYERFGESEESTEIHLEGMGFEDLLGHIRDKKNWLRPSTSTRESSSSRTPPTSNPNPGGNKSAAVTTNKTSPKIELVLGSSSPCEEIHFEIQELSDDESMEEIRDGTTPITTPMNGIYPIINGITPQEEEEEEEMEEDDEEDDEEIAAQESIDYAVSTLRAHEINGTRTTPIEREIIIAKLVKTRNVDFMMELVKFDRSFGPGVEAALMDIAMQESEAESSPVVGRHQPDNDQVPTVPSTPTPRVSNISPQPENKIGAEEMPSRLEEMNGSKIPTGGQLATASTESSVEPARAAAVAGVNVNGNQSTVSAESKQPESECPDPDPVNGNGELARSEKINGDVPHYSTSDLNHAGEMESSRDQDEEMEMNASGISLPHKGEAEAEAQAHAIKTESNIMGPEKIEEIEHGCIASTTPKSSTSVHSGMVISDDSKSNESTPDYTELSNDSSTSSPKMAPPPIPNIRAQQYVLPIEIIPWVPPSSVVQTGILAESVIMDIWYESRGWLRICRCSICERSKRKELDERILYAGGGGEKRPRFF